MITSKVSNSKNKKTCFISLSITESYIFEPTVFVKNIDGNLGIYKQPLKSDEENILKYY